MKEPLDVMLRELELAVLERDIEMAGAGGDPTARRVIEARKRVVDVATRLLPYRSPRLAAILVRSTDGDSDLERLSDAELWELAFGEGANGAGAKGGAGEPRQVRDAVRLPAKPTPPRRH